MAAKARLLRWGRFGVELGDLERAVETDFVVDPGRASTAGVGMEGVIGMGLCVGSLDVAESALRREGHFTIVLVPGLTATFSESASCSSAVGMFRLE
jgi:hypothetical protein